MADAAAAGTSVVVVSFHTGPALSECLDSVLDQEGLAELVVVDNGNPEETRRWLASRAAAEPRLTVLAGHGNVGFAAGCNRGVAASRGRTILLLNPDCVIEAGTLIRGQALLAGRSEAALVGGRLLNPDGSDQRGGRRHLLTPASAIVEGFRLDRLGFTRVNRHEEDLPAGPVEIDCVSGAFMLMPRRLYDSVGGMDEGYFLHVEDIDFCLRVKRAGGVVMFDPGLNVRHRRGTSRSSVVRVEWHKARGFIRYFHKHFGNTGWLPILPFVDALVLMRFAVRAIRLGLAQAIAGFRLNMLPLLAIL